MWRRNLLFLVLCGSGLLALGASLSPAPRRVGPPPLDRAEREPGDFHRTLQRVNAVFRADWQRRNLTPAPPADDLVIARRMALALRGDIPSLEEIRQIEAAPPASRLDQYLAGIFQDRRFFDYLAERLARAFVGTKDGTFLIYRRGRLVSWLADQLEANRPYDALVRDLIASTGLGTDQPAANFVIATIKPGQDENQPDESELAARVSRAFLGVRIDCAECHDHPFEPWKQADFRGLAAFFSQTQFKFTGLRDASGIYEVEDPRTGTRETIAPRPPSHPELLPERGTLRQRLAAWVTHPGNERFAQAVVNRVWALMLGRALVEPVDDIRAGEPRPAALDILAEDFVAHGYDLRRLIQLIAATDVFRLDSRASRGGEVSVDHTAAWAAFPLTRLRPEQVVGSLQQAVSLQTLDRSSNIILRLAQTLEQAEFLKRYGDAGEDELSDQGGTIPQRLLLLNGKLVRDKTKETPLLNTTSQIAALAPDDQTAVESIYLAALSRRPTPPEVRHFAAELAAQSARRRSRKVEDILCVLINSTEFSWNH